MTRGDIDFVARAPRPWFGLALALLALAALTLALGQAWWLRQHTLGAAVRDARPAATRAPLTESQRRSLIQVKSLAAQITAPWSDLLAVFEQHTLADVGLLRLEPDARSGRVKLSAEAKDVSAMMIYFTALEADPRLVDVVLANHQLERDVPGKPVRFTVQAGWRPVPTVTAAKRGLP
jgi:hypothetical protein